VPELRESQHDHPLNKGFPAWAYVASGRGSEHQGRVTPRGDTAAAGTGSAAPARPRLSRGYSERVADSPDSSDYAYLWAWEPLSPKDVLAIMRGFRSPWWVCGGSALDLFIGRETRRHDDLDVAVLRRDQALLRSHLRRWDLRYATPEHTLESWDGSWLAPPIHGIWARRSTDQHAAWACEFLLNEAADDEWVFLRDARIRRSLASVGSERDGIPYLRPEIVLLYKASEPSPKNEADFTAAAGQLPDAATAWLTAALRVTRPNHHWLERLVDP
jgi:hypothetical protein